GGRRRRHGRSFGRARLGRAGRRPALIQSEEGHRQGGHSDHDHDDGIGIHRYILLSPSRWGRSAFFLWFLLYPVSGGIATAFHRRPMRGVASVKPTSSLSPIERLMAVP